MATTIITVTVTMLALTQPARRMSTQRPAVLTPSRCGTGGVMEAELPWHRPTAQGYRVGQELATTIEYGIFCYRSDLESAHLAYSQSMPWNTWLPRL